MSPHSPFLDGDAVPPNDLVRAQLARILESSPFQRNPRTAGFLSHVVERRMSGRESQIKESTIGVEVFGKDASYDTKSDPLVRSVARVLREKLNDYYLTCPNDPVRIELPKGSYVPLFRFGRVPPTESPSPDPPCKLPAISRYAVVAILSVFVGSPVNSLSLGWAGIPPGLAQDSRALHTLGRRRLSAGDYPGARPLLERAAQLAPGDSLIHADLAVDLRLLSYNSLALEEARKAELNTGGLSAGDQLEVEATFRWVSGDYQAALAALDQLRRQDPARVQPPRAVARVQLEAAMFPECLATIAQSGRVDAQLALIEAFCQAGTGNYRKALEPARRAAALAQRSGISEIYARALLLESGLLMSTGDPQDAAPIRKEAREICTAIGDHSCLVRALRIQGNWDLWRADSGTALREYSSALPLARALGSQGEIVELLNGEGWAWAFLDDFASANRAFVEALLTAQKANLALAGPRLRLAEVALLEGQLPRAGILAEQGIGEAHALGDENLETYAAVLRSQVLMFEGDFAASDQCLLTARKRVLEGGLPNATVTALALADARLNRFRGKLDLAASQLEQARGTSDESTELSIRVEQIELLIGQSRFAEAQATAGQTLAILDRLNRSSESALVTGLLSDSYGYGMQLPEARTMVRRALQMLTPRSTPLARITVLIAAGRWVERGSEGIKYLQDAIDLAHRTGFGVAEQEAAKILREKYPVTRVALP